MGKMYVKAAVALGHQFRFWYATALNRVTESQVVTNCHNTQHARHHTAAHATRLPSLVDLSWHNHSQQLRSAHSTDSLSSHTTAVCSETTDG